ncbi:hypothetical protein P3T76_014307 [Phytophthora citrophthora]|uniref:Uncharacterized protein n=1 Tax=Phytophthora citrophthora TaxID=4793 RepID=A0AAD9G1W0_9STRA|nr:hypothetical protein P3T76_014307 [Phytophthora citrophthora]
MPAASIISEIDGVAASYEAIEKPSMASGAASARDEAVAEDDTSSCCIGCFKLMPLPPESPPESSESPSDLINDNNTAEPELLCASCIHRLAGKSSKSPAVQSNGGGCAVLSPLPKLSLLVRAEAKCQDQLEQLRSQQEILNQQRESLEATKRAKEEAVAAERELARQRRKHFLMIQERRRREEELKLQVFQGEELTSRSEQGNSTDRPKKHKPRPPRTGMLQRRKFEIATEMEPSDVSLPQVSVEIPLSNTTASNDSVNTAEAQTMSLSERRRQMMVCYSQDLSPLIDGRKPRRIPFPKPVAAIVPSAMIRRRHTSDNNGLATVSSNHRDKSSRKQGTRNAPKITKLHPLDEQKRFIKSGPLQHFESNQFEDFHDRGSNGALQRLRRLSDHSVALTAEIKHVSWAYDLTKDVLQENDSMEDAGSLNFSAPVYPTQTDQVDTGPQFTMFPLQHQLPNPTFPVSKPEPLPVVTTNVPRWEYSAERLSSLLEKYKVSVSAVATSTSFGQ